MAERQIERVAVIGAGAAGRSFALRCVTAGFLVTLEDVMPEKLRRAEDDYTELTSAAAALRFATTVEDAVADADIAIDFVPDELESKLELFSLLDRMAPPHTILCTPTDALSISDLASCTYRPDRCIALSRAMSHLVRGTQTSSDVAAAVGVFLDRLDVTFFTVVDETESMLTKRM